MLEVKQGQSSINVSMAVQGHFSFILGYLYHISNNPRKTILNTRLPKMAVDKKVLKTCLVCKRKFLGWFSEKYCSDDCRAEGTRLKNRNRQRKSRKVLDLREGAISQQLGELGLGDTQYPMYNHELVTTMYANVSLYHGRDGKRHVRSYYDLIREIAKLNGGDTSKILSRLAPRDQN